MTKKMTFEERLEYMSRLSPDDWDKICRGCGLCCLNKYYREDGKIEYASVACKNLDTQTRKCKCYEARLCRGACHKVDLALVRDARVLPASCAYVEILYGDADIKPDVNWEEVVSESSISPIKAQKRIIPGSENWTHDKK